jgi:hypothetical protein
LSDNNFFCKIKTFVTQNKLSEVSKILYQYWLWAIGIWAIKRFQIDSCVFVYSVWNQSDIQWRLTRPRKNQLHKQPSQSRVRVYQIAKYHHNTGHLLLISNSDIYFVPCLIYRMSQFLMEHWMIVGIMAPCIVALYLILIMVGYHIFCKRQETESNHDNFVGYSGQIEVRIA